MSNELYASILSSASQGTVYDQLIGAVEATADAPFAASVLGGGYTGPGFGSGKGRGNSWFTFQGLTGIHSQMDFWVAMMTYAASYYVGKWSLRLIAGPPVVATGAIDIVANITAATQAAGAVTAALFTQGIGLGIAVYDWSQGRAAGDLSRIFSGASYGMFSTAATYWNGVNIGLKSLARALVGGIS